MPVEKRFGICNPFFMYKRLIRELLATFFRFKKEAGLYFFTSSLLAKILSFLASWLALRLLDNEELGKAIFAYQIIVFVLPFMGLGLGSGLWRYGALQEKRADREAFFVEALRKGLLVNVLLIAALWVFSGPLVNRIPGSKTYLQIFSLMLLSNHLAELVKIYALVIKRNVYFALQESAQHILLVIFVYLGAKYADVRGYAWAFVLAPLLASFLCLPFLGIGFSVLRKRVRKSFLSLEVWRYGFFSSLGNVATQLLFVIDVLLIGVLLQSSEEVTAYKYLSLIPFSALFLSQIYMRAHFVELTQKIKDRAFLLGFIKRYHLLFALLYGAFFSFCFLLRRPLLAVFDTAFLAFEHVFLVLCLGVGGIFLLRGLYGNLLSAMGKSQWNFYIGLFSLLVNLFFNYLLIPLYGILGAAMTSAVVMWLSGGMSLFWVWINLPPQSSDA